MLCNRPMTGWPDKMLNMLLPHRCLLCGQVVGEPHALCPQCWPKMQFIQPPYCACCGLPFPHDFGGETLCARCLSDPPPYSVARAALAYTDDSKGIVLKFKHGDQLHLAPSFARWMVRAASAWFEEGQVVLVPVPLHWTRMFLRRYNQSALIALAMQKLTGQSAALDALVRHRRTPRQGALSREARLKNVAGAFRVSKQWREKIKGKIVVLIDDVLTTGATVLTCAKVLQRAGAADVRVLTLMRVV